MSDEVVKLGIIERLMRVRDRSSLDKIEKLVIQAEMEARTNESLQAIKEEKVISFDQFQEGNKKWMEKRNSKS